MSKRANPAGQPSSYKKLNQGVGNPVANESNTDSGNPAALKGVKQNPSAVLSQRVVNPSVGKARGGADVAKRGK